MASNTSFKRRRTSSSAGDTVMAKRPQASPRLTYRDTYVSGSANVHLGDCLHFEDPNIAIQQELRRLQDSLSFAGMHGRYEGLREAADQTYKWILNPKSYAVPTRKRDQTASFFNWFRCGGGIFWVSGKPGSGKSTLMKYLAEHIAYENPQVDQTNLVVLSFFFWINGDELQRSKTGCMRSLLWQLLQEPSTTNLAMKACQRYYTGVWTESVIRTTLSAILKETKHPVAIFLDGLDESNDHDDVVASLTVFRSLAKVRTCVSSRPEPIFSDALSSCQSLRLQDLNAMDIEQVVESSFLGDTRVLALAAKLTTDDQKRDLEFLGQAIRIKSEGVFLWVHLVIKDLLRGITQKDDLTMLSRRLHRLPNDIYALFKDMLQRTHHDYELYKDKIALYLSLALHRKLSVIEFCFAINEALREKYLCPAIFNSQADVDTGVDIDCETVMTQVHAHTAGLLELEVHDCMYYEGMPTNPYPPADQNLSLAYKITTFSKRGIGFVHRTAHDFLRNTTEGISLMTVSSRPDAEIKQICFETKLIRNVVLPGILGQCISIDVGHYLFTCEECSDEDIHIALKKQGQDIVNSLRSTGLLLPDSSTWVISTEENSRAQKIAHPFPSSNHAAVDFVPVLITAGRLRAARMWLDDYECMDDGEYLTKLLARLVRDFPTFDSHGQREAKALLKALVENGADPYRNLTTQIGETFYPMSLPPLGVARLSPGVLQEIDQLVGITETEVYTTRSPSCFDCHEVWYNGTNYPPIYLFWGDFELVDIRGLRSAEDVITYCSKGQLLRSENSLVFVIASVPNRLESRRKLPHLWMPSEEDSRLLINSITQESENLVVSDCLGILKTLPDYPCVGGRRSIFANLIKDICARSPVLSFAAAMEYIGKSQETIEGFYVSEAERMEREYPDTRKGWKRWYWGSATPPKVAIDRK